MDSSEEKLNQPVKDTPALKAPSRVNNFALLHLFAAFMVIWGHCFSLSGAGISAPVIFDDSIHSVGVKMLFIISGYLTAISFFHTKKTRNYYIKRVLRIYPPFAACILLSVLLLYFLSGGQSFGSYMQSATTYLKTNLTFKISYTIPGIFADNPYKNAINGALWTLPVEFFLQLILPLLMFPTKKLKNRKIYASVLYLLFLAAYFGLDRVYTFKFTYHGLDFRYLITLGVYFYAGSFFACLDRDTLTRFCRPDLSLLGAATVLLFGSSYPSNYLSPIILPYIVITAALVAPAVFSDFCNKHDIAYGLYLFGFPIQQTIMHFAAKNGTKMQPLYLLLCTTPFVILLAVLQKKLLEKPLGKLTKRLTVES